MKSEHVESTGKGEQTKANSSLSSGSGFAGQGADVVALVAHRSANHSKLVSLAQHAAVLAQLIWQSATCYANSAH